MSYPVRWKARRPTLATILPPMLSTFLILPGTCVVPGNARRRPRRAGQFPPRPPPDVVESPGSWIAALPEELQDTVVRLVGLGPHPRPSPREQLLSAELHHPRPHVYLT